MSNGTELKCVVGYPNCNGLIKPVHYLMTVHRQTFDYFVLYFPFYFLLFLLLIDPQSAP